MLNSHKHLYRPYSCYNKEGNSQHYVSNVTPYVVEGTENERRGTETGDGNFKWMSTLKVIVAQVFISSCVK